MTEQVPTNDSSIDSAASALSAGLKHEDNEQLRIDYKALNEYMQRMGIETPNPGDEVPMLIRHLDDRQARIDALMLEYCPDEMTEAQKENWAKHQRQAGDDMHREIGSALMGSNVEVRRGPPQKED